MPGIYKGSLKAKRMDAQRVYRSDKAFVRLDSLQQHDDGSITVDAVLTRAGVFDYIGAGGVRVREFRSLEEVMNPASLDTAKLVPFTNEHPPQLLDTSNTNVFQVGTVGENIRSDGMFVLAKIRITDAETIADIKAGKREISMGYEADVLPQRGMFRGQAFDAVQTNIVYNHGSLVSMGRAGPEARLRMDAAIQVERSSKMETIEIFGMTFEVTPEVAVLFKALMAMAESQGVSLEGKPTSTTPATPVAPTDADPVAAAEEDPAAPPEPRTDKGTTMTDAEKARMDALEEENTKLKAEAKKKKAAKEKKEDKAAFEKSIEERITLEAKASRFTKDESDFRGKTDREVQIAAIEARYPDASTKFDDKSDEYVKMRFDVMADELDDEDSTGDLHSNVDDTVRTDSSDKKADKARADAIKTRRDAWRKPMTASTRTAPIGA